MRGRCSPTSPRKALTRQGQAGYVAEPEAFYGFQPLSRRGAVISNEMIDRFREEDVE